MTNRDAAVLAFKLLGLWLVANAAIGFAGLLPYYWEPVFENTRGVTIFATLLPILIAVGIGVPVWFSADWFAGRIFPNASPEPVRLDRLRGEPLFALALSILGVMFLCEALPIVVHGAALFIQSRSAGSSILGPDIEQQRLVWSTDAKANAIAGIARLLIGVALLAGPARLAATVSRLRKELKGTLADDDEPKRDGQTAVEQADGADGASRRHPA